MHALVKSVQNLAQNIDDTLLFLNYSKAFDHVDPNLLFSKLKQIDVPDVIIFFQGDKQKVQCKIVNLYGWIFGEMPHKVLFILEIFLFLIMHDSEMTCPSVKFVDDSIWFILLWTIVQHTAKTNNKYLQMRL